MKKYIWILMAFVIIYSCEEDDICIDATTPRMLVKFQNANQEFITLDTLVVQRIDPTGNTEIINTQGVDSVFLPLRLDNVSATQFLVARQRTNPVYDTLEVSYDRNQQFVSKACGFKIDYLNVNYQSTQLAIDNVEGLINQITNETAPHLIIRY